MNVSNAQGEKRPQRLVFGEAPELYDRARPSYPDQLIEDVWKFAALNSSARALEIGSGTGKATVLFAARDLELVCLEPDPGMAAVARENVAQYPRVQIVDSSFEDWSVDQDKDGALTTLLDMTMATMRNLRLQASLPKQS